MTHLLLIVRRQELPSDNLTECLQRLAARFRGQCLPQLGQQNPPVLQKGGAPSSSLHMAYLRVVHSETPATTRRVAARRTPILPDAQEKVDTDRDHGYCDCFVCGDTYQVETDAFNDGAMHYYPAFLAQRLAHGGDDE